MRCDFQRYFNGPVSLWNVQVISHTKIFSGNLASVVSKYWINIRKNTHIRKHVKYKIRQSGEIKRLAPLLWQYKTLVTGQFVHSSWYHVTNNAPSPTRQKKKIKINDLDDVMWIDGLVAITQRSNHWLRLLQDLVLQNRAAHPEITEDIVYKCSLVSPYLAIRWHNTFKSETCLN